MTGGTHTEMTSPLSKHGIQTERAAYRCHVCLGEGGVYVFSTASALHAISQLPDKYKRSAYQQGVDGPTAQGYVVKIKDIPGCVVMKIPQSILEDARRRVNIDSPTSAKGQAARDVVIAMLQRGSLPLPMAATIAPRQDDIDGIDLYVENERWSLQVKCDWKGGLTGTGNLYIQTHERNPLGRV
jgi:hypothetical protein